MLCRARVGRLERRVLGMIFGRATSIRAELCDDTKTVCGLVPPEAASQSSRWSTRYPVHTFTRPGPPIPHVILCCASLRHALPKKAHRAREKNLLKPLTTRRRLPLTAHPCASLTIEAHKKQHHIPRHFSVDPLSERRSSDVVQSPLSYVRVRVLVSLSTSSIRGRRFRLSLSP